jgi:hypothetical protein
MDADQFMKLWETFRTAPPDSLTLMACMIVNGAVQVQHIERLGDLLAYPDETLIVVQRRTGTDIKFAEFTIEQFRAPKSRFDAHAD